MTELLSITEVERRTGIRQGTLRMWEKRYGFPQPLRDRHGDRVYPLSQVERLLAVRRLMAQGARPGKILSGHAMPETAAAAPQALDAGGLPAEFLPALEHLRAYRRAELHAWFQYRLLDLGLRRFVIECLAPLSTAVGLAWSRGEMPVRCEHLYTQLAMSVLHAKQAAIRSAGDGRPKVILATLAGEPHGLGIMMAEAVMASLGMNCIQLGSEVPPSEVEAAARETGADIVALSFSSYFLSKTSMRMLVALRARLPAAASLWVGGAGMPAAAGSVPGVEAVGMLEAIEAALARWQADAAMQPPRLHAS
jgi:DNA-binding transcriptional MerR regulator/methylmalonyl-CoA mutase cobalamin-binding subunit